MAFLSAPAYGSSTTEPTVLVMPFEQPADAHRDLGFGIEIKALGALHAAGALNVVHPKIRQAVARRNAEIAKTWDAETRRQRFGTYVGATWTLEGRITSAADKTTIALRLASIGDSSKAFDGKVDASTLEKAIAAVPARLLALLNQADGRARKYERPVSPATNRPDALARLGTCYRMLNQQSVGIKKPALLNEVRLKQAANRCRAALARAPDLAEAEAGLAMIDALEGRADAAKARLTKIKAHAGFLAYYWIAKFWVLAKFYSPDDAVETLAEGVERYPAFLLGRGYLCEGLSALKKHERALAAYRTYLERVPDQPFIMSAIGHELAKLGKHAEALAITRRALALDETNAETRLELGSRMIDAGRFADAVAVLAKLVAEVPARGEVYLRLGFAYLRTDRLEDAEGAFKRALEKATAPKEWRTRGRAQYDLAKVFARQKRPDQALEALSAAIDAGFQRPSTFAKDGDFATLKDDPRFRALLTRTPEPPQIPALYQSPFLADTADVARDAAKRTLGPGRRSAITF